MKPENNISTERSKLSARERDTLNKLAWGWSYLRIAEHLKIEAPNLHVICHHIRQKTGITNTKNAEECRNWQRGHQPITPPWYQPGPTPMQMEVMRLRSLGLSYVEIGSQLSMVPQTAQNHCSQGCKRAKIGLAKHNRIYALQAYFKAQDAKNAPPAPAPSPTVPDDF